MIVGHTISSNKFSYNKQDKTFVTEASDLKGIPFDGLLYDDAADGGFVMRSEKTGQTQAYYLNRNIYTSDYDLTAQEFLPAEPLLPGAEGTKVIIYND